ncbi:splicing factor u2af large subunit [Lasallia pustulata]|uniref:Splicing factor u2af large subunit n=1 Tax=Lasallia pustulata TaxID=136370 RepID=A0A1W5CU62_9LECA|nr:splicing factor u2af large subunit [Lasallia pustulata]
MNGDSYSARGMASTTTLPRIRKHETDTSNPSATDSGRYGSSRDHYSSRDDRRGDRDRDSHRGSDRRRSRSPGHRSSRGTRRELEVDSYSSSRDYRAREREDRYSGRDAGRDDRAWDRDRGDRADRGDRGDRGMSRRDARREDDDRPPRRDRDLFEGRGDRGRGGGRAGRSDRDEFAMQMGGRDRKKSASPPPKKKEPTPDLTDVVPITERKRRLTQWDIKPPGYENVTAEQAKLSGMFPLPGAPRQQPMDPSRLQAFMNQPSGSASNAALKPSNARQSKRLFVHNLPASATEENIVNFLNLQLNGLNVIQGIDPCISAQISKDRSFALIEFKTPAEATVGLALDGITMEDSDSMDTTNGAANGSYKGLSVRRPKDYIVPSVTDDADYQEGVVSSVVPDTQNKLSVTNIPLYLTDEQVVELLKSFGELKAFVLVKDSSTEESRGIAFCEYLDPSATDIAVEGLNGMELADKHLKVQRASIGVTQAAGLEMGVNAMSLLAGTTSNDLEEGRVLQLLNMVTPEELIDNEDYEEICEDVKEECDKYGEVLEMKVPRPSGGSRQSAGVGKIFVKYDSPESARKAMQALAGRKFADRTVVVTYFSEENFEVNAW